MKKDTLESKIKAVMSELGKRSIEARRKKYTKEEFSKIMKKVSKARLKKKLSTEKLSNGLTKKKKGV